MYHEEYEDILERKINRLEKYTILTPADVMEVLNIGKNTMYDLLNSGKLIGFHVGRNWRISSNALEDFIRSQPRIPR